MMGHLFGVPFHKSLQSDIVMSCLNLLSVANETYVIERYEKTWAEARREGKKLELEID